VDINHNQLIIQPHSDDKKPSMLAKIFHALQDILQALTKLHTASWMHCDIQWANVIKHHDGSGLWFLIDFMDAAKSLQLAATGQHLSHDKHAPRFSTKLAIQWQLPCGL